MEVDAVFTDEMTWGEAAPSVACTREFELAREGWRTTIVAGGTMTSDRSGFDVSMSLDAALNGEPCATRTWTFRIPRRSA